MLSWFGQTLSFWILKVWHFKWRCPFKIADLFGRWELMFQQLYYDKGLLLSANRYTCAFLFINLSTISGSYKFLNNVFVRILACTSATHEQLENTGQVYGGPHSGSCRRNDISNQGIENMGRTLFSIRKPFHYMYTINVQKCKKNTNRYCISSSNAEPQERESYVNWSRNELRWCICCCDNCLLGDSTQAIRYSATTVFQLHR